MTGISVFDHRLLADSWKHAGNACYFLRTKPHTKMARC